MRKFLTAALISCGLFANASSQPLEAVGNDAAKECAESSCNSKQANHANAPPADTPVPEDLRVQHSTPLEQNHANNHQQKTTEIDASSPEEEGESSWSVTEWGAFTSGAGSLISAFMAIFLAVLGFYSWRTSKAAVDIAKDSLDASKQLATNQSRPYLFITKIEMIYQSLYDEAANQVSVTLKNYGQTPAQLTSFSAKIIEGVDQRETVVEEKLIRNALGHGETIDMQVVFRTPNAAQINAGKEPLRLLISAQYQGMNGALHHTREPFVFSLDRRNYGFIPCDSDERRSRD